MINIAFCINRSALSGLRVTISSLIQNSLETEWVYFWIFCNDLKSNKKSSIQDLLDQQSFREKFVFIDFGPEEVFSSLRSLNGDRTTYGRLLLADYVSGEQMLYLDADLVVAVDILELENHNFYDFDHTAVPAGTIKTELEREFYINKLHLSENTVSFNAGVLL